MNNPDVYTLMTGTEKKLSESDLRISADVGRLAVNDYLRGLSAIGNLTSHACNNENYTDHVHDLEALAAFLTGTAQMARATRFFSDHADYMADATEQNPQQGGKGYA
ncbi:hypothetical protein [Yersinia pseudotuberculosis]|uniref:hypothetical protein n=1 Tax=Yersinia pseudotuberculosis TaxID=633 RepID=UPI0005E83BC9|nr:hypothetical protein [Yersinia pseudotuberculosis]CND45445.1 Uncharacterised protein [Yersinia pseudotuberculosis]